jgi:hypothetical protein
MTHKTVEHLLGHEALCDAIRDRYKVSHDLHVEEIAQQLHGVVNQFPFTTYEAVDLLPTEAFDYLLSSAIDDNVIVSDDVANAFTSIEPINGNVLTSAEMRKAISHMGFEPNEPANSYELEAPLVIVNHSDDNIFSNNTKFDELSDEQQSFVVSVFEATRAHMGITNTNIINDGVDNELSDVSNLFDGLDDELSQSETIIL